MDALRAARLVKAQKLSDLGSASQRFDQFGVVFHGEDYTPCLCPVSNVACIDPMTAAISLHIVNHPSIERLLSFVRASARVRPELAHAKPEADIQIRLGVSPQVFTNWKKRGISKEGALDAQRELGVNAWWLLQGEGQQVAPDDALLQDIVTACRLLTVQQRATVLLVAKAHLAAPAEVLPQP